MADDPTLQEIIREDIKDHETRIRSLEQWLWRLVGASFILGALGASAVKVVIEGP